MKQTYKIQTSALFAAICLLVIPLLVSASESSNPSEDPPYATSSFDIRSKNEDSVSSSTTVFNSLSISGTLEASFTRDSITGTWTAHAVGTYSGIGGNAAIADTFIYGANDQGTILDTQYVNGIPETREISSPFHFSIPIPSPDLNWTQAGFGIHLTDSSGTYANLRSPLFPIIWENPLLLDHAKGGSIADSPNYVPAGIPAGIGIPHALINGIPEGNYYAVVFFQGLVGCPSENYEINSFKPGASWGYDIIGTQQQYSKTWSSSAGGCMQQFHIDPKKTDGWMWGALSNTGTANAIADENGIPAFAICGTKAACDSLTPQTTPSPEGTSTATSSPGQKISSVFFLPGIKGSELYESADVCDVLSVACDIVRWLPLHNLLVPKLFMNVHGKSIQNIYVKEGDLLDGAFGYSFYKSFITMMNTSQSSGTFGNNWTWRAIAYDWRLSISDLVNGGVERNGRVYYGESSDTSYIEKSLRELASSSPTGKVTIIAHSNGGLVAKALMQKLGDAETVRLIDSVIFVGVPQSGAPRALGSLLYGEGESIPSSGLLKNIIMSAAQAREFALNSPMAYHLLPSAIYTAIQNSTYPLVKFEGEVSLATYRAAYGESINSPEEFHNFALSTEGARTQPNTDDLDSASVVNEELLTTAEKEHAAIDAWIPPAGIEVYQIGGYGINTISGIDVYEASSSGNTSASPPSYRPLFTLDGDGTVPVISAFLIKTSAHVHSIWVNLRILTEPHYSHGTLLEMPYIQNVISTILSGKSSTLGALAAQSVSTEQKQMAFFLHGNGSLSITDSNGRSAGAAISGNEEQIPGSESGVFGNVTYTILPANEDYTLHIFSNATTTLTLDMQDRSGDTVTASSTLYGIPSTPTSIATLTVHDSIQTASPLQTDTDGDGVTNTTVEGTGSTTEASTPATSKISSSHTTSSSVSNTVLSTSTQTHEVETAIPAERLSYSTSTPLLVLSSFTAQEIKNTAVPRMKDDSVFSTTSTQQTYKNLEVSSTSPYPVKKSNDSEQKRHSLLYRIFNFLKLVFQKIFNRPKS